MRRGAPRLAGPVLSSATFEASSRSHDASNVALNEASARGTPPDRALTDPARPIGGRAETGGRSCLLAAAAGAAAGLADVAGAGRAHLDAAAHAQRRVGRSP